MNGEDTAVVSAVEQGTGTADGGNVEQADQQTSTPQGTATTPNWDSEENPYRQRFTGLQGNFKQVNERMQAMEQQQAVERQQGMEQMAVWQAQAQGLGPVEVEQARQGARQQATMQAQLQQFVGGVQQERAQLEMERQMLEPVARFWGVNKLSQETGVPVAELEEAIKGTDAEQDPRSARVLAQYINRSKRTQKLDQRKRDGVDTAESGGGGSRPTERMSSDEQIRTGLADYMRTHGGR